MEALSVVKPHNFQGTIEITYIGNDLVVFVVLPKTFLKFRVQYIHYYTRYILTQVLTFRGPTIYVLYAANLLG